MRRKPLPPPPDELTGLREAQEAVPLVPGTEEDCCSRLQHRLGLPGRDTAATWLDFLRGLGLATEKETGFSRVRVDPDVATIADQFVEVVYGAEEQLDLLEAHEEPLSAGTVAEETRELVSPWERQRDGPDWTRVWEARTRDLLEWLVLLDLAEHTENGYHRGETD